MKTLLFISALLFSSTIFSQDILGDWHGKLSVSGMQLRIVLHIIKSDTAYSSTLDSPDQGAFGMETNSTILIGNELKIISNQLGANYKATVGTDELTGIFTQGGREYDLVLTKKELPKAEIKRPQEPKPKFNYLVQEVEFRNEIDNIALSGTITLPKGKGPFAVAVMISGSGPQDRNEEILGHKPFWVIADHMAKNNIAILRFDDRGVGKSGGKFAGATSLDFVKDVEAAVAFLKTQKKINPKKIGLIGHSEGGLIAPMVAANTKNNIAFAVLMAGPGIPGSEIIILQQELISRVNGTSEEEIAKDKRWTEKLFQFMEQNLNSSNFDTEMKQFIDSLNTAEKIEIPNGMTQQQLNDLMFDSFCDPWMKYFLFLDPTIALAKVKCPVLAINGSLDLQVPPTENLSAIKKHIESNGNSNVTIKEFPRLNHLFQECATGSPNEYGSIVQTISPEVLKTMTEWINGDFRF